MRGDTGPGVTVSVLADGHRLRLVSGNELVGDWIVGEIGINVLHEGFNIRAEGEEFVLRTDDDVALAEQIGVAAASPRLARRLAVRHNPEEPPPPEEVSPVRSNLGAIGLALAGGLMILGGTLLNRDSETATASATLRSVPEGFEFWLAFVIGGVLMIAAAYVMSLGARVARLIATLLLVGMIITFGFLVSGSQVGVTEIMPYGFIAGGLVVGVAVLVSGSLRQSD